MDANKGLYLDLVQRAEDLGSKNENLDIIERGKFRLLLFFTSILTHTHTHT